MPLLSMVAFLAAVMLSVNERAGALMSGIDVNEEPLALGAPDSPIFTLGNGTRITIAATPVGSATFPRYCAMMRRSDLLADARLRQPACGGRILRRFWPKCGRGC